MDRLQVRKALASLAVDFEAIPEDLALKAIRAVDAGADATDLNELIFAEASMNSVLRAIAEAIGLDFADLHDRTLMMSPDEDLVSSIGTDYLSEKVILPMRSNDGEVVLVASNPEDQDAVNHVRARAGSVDRVVMASKAQIRGAILVAASITTAIIEPGPRAVVNWVDALLVQALASRASDIHFRYGSDGSLFVRSRIDGVLRKITVPEAIIGRENEVVAQVIARCSTMDGSNLREPQDGSFSFDAAGKTTEVRVALIPQMTGANLTLRLLDSSSIKRTPESMGIRYDYIERLREIIALPQGCLVIVGPTGSGKTTTLYTLLGEIDAVSSNVMTVEDPVEYRLPHVGQTAIRDDLGERSVTWARALRSLLRSDPDVVLVGEIRDHDVAQTALEASSTGHLVLTTLHAQTAPSAFTRLTQMGLKPFEIAEAVTAVVSQRLIRTLCECSKEDHPNQEEVQVFTDFGLDAPETIRRPIGCTSCSGTGFAGRAAIIELLVTDESFRDTISVPGVPSSEVERAARAAGWMPLTYDALRAVAEGRTTIDEARRVTGLIGALPTEGETASDTDDFASLPSMTFGFGDS